MSRTEKKCLIASLGTHLFLLFLLAAGSAFFVSREKTFIDDHRIRVLPSRLVEEALSGGGGSPNIPPNNGQEKGNTIVLPPPEIKPAAPVAPQRPAPPVTPIKPLPELVKPSSKPNNTITKPEPLPLNRVIRGNMDKRRHQEEAEAREAERLARNAAKQISRIKENLKAGFSQGTIVQVSGPGGEAYANYALTVKNFYEDAWVVADELMEDDSTAKVSVTIARTGHVIAARIKDRSGNSTLDKSVQRALDKVRFIAPFPEGSREEQKTFIINFNLKAKRSTG